jgi:lysozyme family protein
MINIGSIGERIFSPDNMEWEERTNEFITNLLTREGGDTLTTDTGGLTKYGISTRAHGDQGYDIANLTESQAREIYKEQYIPEAVNRIGKNNVVWKFIDMNVNMGWGNATAVLQKALGIKPDGKFGKETVNILKREINKWGEDEIIYILTKAQREYYDELRRSDPQKYGKYKGWDERARYNPIKE